MDAISLSALQHYLFCPRQCALIHVEQIWRENRFTVEGQHLHSKTNEGPDEHRAACTILRHLHVASERLGLTGICDVVERYPDGRFVPVEYKRGKPKRHRADEVQLCAQALCLEEMMHVSIPVGLLFYGKTRRRLEVPLDQPLRELTEHTVRAIRTMIDSGQTPATEYADDRCPHCSLLEDCLPGALRFRRGAAAWFKNSLRAED